MKYFNDCRTLDEVKAMFKTLAKQYHPDCGGDTETMQAINAEYAYACAHILKATNLSQEDSEEALRLSEEYRAVIELLMPIAGIVIEVVANWIWVTGATYPVKKELKAAGLFFASKKQAWYYRSEEFKTTGSKKSLDEIRAKYGAETIHTQKHHKVIAH